MKVLIAEDDPPMREGITELLSREGFEVLAVSNGREAIEHYQTQRPDFVVLDIMMPEMTGYDVVRTIRRRDASTPVIFLSAKSEEIDRVLGLELGADDFIMKPFGARELIARIRAVARRTLARSSSPQQARFVMDDLVIEPKELRAYRDSSETMIELSVREVSILRVLYDNRDLALDRDELYNQVWGHDHYPNSRTLDQHISKLRRKIEKDPKTPRIIRTIVGVGYRFDS